MRSQFGGTRIEPDEGRIRLGTWSVSAPGGWEAFRDENVPIAIADGTERNLAGNGVLERQANLVREIVYLLPPGRRFGIPPGAIALLSADPTDDSIDTLADAIPETGGRYSLRITGLHGQWTHLAGYAALGFECQVEIGSQRLGWVPRSALRLAGYLPLRIRVLVMDTNERNAAVLIAGRAFNSLSPVFERTLESSQLTSTT